MTPREALVQAVRDAATVAISWQNDKKKRTLFLEEGHLVFIQSNLKSETVERIAEKFPDLSADDHKKRSQEVRFRGILSEVDGETRTLSPSPTPPGREPSDVFAQLSACADLLPAPAPTAFPRVVTAPLLQRIPMNPALRDYLWELDGTRDVDEVTSFAPAPPDTVDRAFRIAFALGAITDSGRATTFTTSVIEPQSKASSPTEVFPSGWETSRPTSKPKNTSFSSEDLFGGDLFGGPDLGMSAVRPTEDPIKKWFGSNHTRITNAENHFQVLGVSWEDPPEVMRKTYFSLARDLHPDRFTDAPPDMQNLATELFDKARAAWEVLGDDTQREAYIARVIRGEKTEEEKAAEKIHQILEGESLFKRGVNDLNSGRIAPAHELFKQACTLVPEEPEFRGYLAYTTFRIQHGKDEEAARAGLDDLRTVLKEKEQLDNVWVLLGMAQRIRGEDTIARKAFIKALQLRPSNPDAMREMKRLEAQRTGEKPGEKNSDKPESDKAADKAPGFFARLFGKK